MKKIDKTARDEVCIRRALTAQRFIPCFQPVHDAVTGKVVGAEMLARMGLPDGRLLSPATFFPYVMAAGKITTMTQVLLDKTSDWMRTFNAKDPFTLSFNVLPDMSGEVWLKEACGKILNASGSSVTVAIELTECSPMTIPQQALRRSLSEFREVGVKIALDDFGTGYSGPLRLQQTDADIIKIPREFIRGLPECRVSYGIIDSIMLLASRLDLRVIAEGVETPSQVNDLLLMGVTNIQGFYYSEPLSGTIMNEYLKDYTSSNLYNAINKNSH